VAFADLAAADHITVLDQALASPPAQWRPDPDDPGRGEHTPKPKSLLLSAFHCSASVNPTGTKNRG
jgi:hypothetical protein